MSEIIDTYGNDFKRIVFTENDHRHAKLVIKLKHIEITQAAFFRHIITGVIEDDPRILEYVNEISKISKLRKAEKAKLQNIGNQKMKEFNLSGEDIIDIFDLIEGDGPLS